jgi:secondary thiamine-phosphate synthase enzyme
MAASLFVRQDACAGLKVCSDLVQLRTESRVQFVDLTELVEERVRRSGVRHGTVLVQTRHTTTGVVVNENEPLLIEDMARTLERAAPRDLRYRHNDLADRPGLPPDESENGDAHCKALLLRASETLAIVDGDVQRGTWQRIFLVELDGPRARSLAIVVMGATAGEGGQ